jgi:hypothetical protein
MFGDKLRKAPEEQAARAERLARDLSQEGVRGVVL